MSLPADAQDAMKNGDFMRELLLTDHFYKIICHILRFCQNRTNFNQMMMINEIYVCVYRLFKKWDEYKKYVKIEKVSIWNAF